MASMMATATAAAICGRCGAVVLGPVAVCEVSTLDDGGPSFVRIIRGRACPAREPGRLPAGGPARGGGGMLAPAGPLRGARGAPPRAGAGPSAGPPPPRHGRDPAPPIR